MTEQYCDTIDGFDFLQNLVSSINSSPHLPEAMNTTFAYLKKHLPIAAISLHRFILPLHAIHMDFLLADDGFHEIGKIMSLDQEDIIYLQAHEQSEDTHCGQSWITDQFAHKFNKFLSDYIPLHDRSFLVAILKAGEETVGHLVLIGNRADCFLQEHVKLIEMMRSSIGITMKNLLQHQKIQTLKVLIADKEKHNSTLQQNMRIPIVGSEGGLKHAVKLIKQVAISSAPVLITGETGTGKELIADAIQYSSSRRNGPYLKVNCGAIPANLIESELFGHQKGAFTGAVSDRIGKFELAKGGTLFLDEIGELALHSQVHLLRVLEDNVLQRVGGNNPIQLDVRIIAATNRSLEDMIHAGTFRKDLYHRLNVFVVDLPPLRDRLQDLPLLIDYFIKKLSHKLNITSDIKIAQNSIKYLHDYHWPGNVRELRNLIERALTLSPQENINLAEYLPYLSENALIESGNQNFIKKMIHDEVLAILSSNNPCKTPQTSKFSHPVNEKTFTEESLALDDVIANHIRKVLKECNYKINGKGGAAEVLKVNPSTLRKKMQKLNIRFEHTVS